MPNSRVRDFRLRAICLAFALVMGAGAAADDSVRSRELVRSDHSDDENAEAVRKASTFCGIKVQNAFLPETKRGHTLCGGAVAEMVSCMSKMLGLGSNCNAHCGNGRDFLSGKCQGKMESCGYMKEHAGSPRCLGPGAVMAFQRTPTPRGRVYGHVQFGCGDRFCSSYKTPLGHSWPNPFGDVCYVPKVLGKLSPDWSGYDQNIQANKQPRFDFEDHPLPRVKNCPGCLKLADLVDQYRNQVDSQAPPDDRLKTALDIADTMRQSSLTVQQLGREVAKLEMRAAMLSALSVAGDDFDSAAVYELMSYCAADRKRFDEVFRSLRSEEQQILSAQMHGFQELDRLGLKCKIPMQNPER